MSYIRWSTPVRKAKGDRRFSKISEAYAWGDVDGYVHISNGYRRSPTGDNDTVRLTHAEMRYMARMYLRQHKIKP